MSTSTTLLFLGAFLACAVEMVEALTILLGVGVVRGWRAPLIGAAAATVTLAALVAALGPALQVIPIDSLRLVVGALLLAFGLQWLRKAILRSSGYKALHDDVNPATLTRTSGRHPDLCRFETPRRFSSTGSSGSASSGRRVPVAPDAQDRAGPKSRGVSS